MEEKPNPYEAPQEPVKQDSAPARLWRRMVAIALLIAAVLPLLMFVGSLWVLVVDRRHIRKDGLAEVATFAFGAVAVLMIWGAFKLRR